jgi:hypothetical protein
LFWPLFSELQEASNPFKLFIMKTSNQNQNLIIVLLELSIFFLLCLAILNAPQVKGQTISGREQIINAKQQKVQKIYTSQIGIREKGSNSGQAVEQYLHYVNLPKGMPWCAAFVCWVFGQAGIENPRSGWSPDLFKGSKVIWGKAESRKLKVESWAAETGEPGTNLPAGQAGSQDPIAIGSRHSRFAYSYPPSQTTGNRQQTTPGTGDVFGIYFPDKNRIAHTGFIDQWDGTWLITVEGNTNVSGGREGDGVYRKRRPVKSIFQVARYIRQP